MLHLPQQFSIARFAALALAMLSCTLVLAQEAVIRKNLPERLPQLPKIDEVSRTPIPGLWEVRYGGTEILYSDDKGEHILVNGSLVETKTRTDLTEARIEKMLAIDWDKLPLKDAMLIRQGNGSRRMAVFVDPNCGYCKRYERDLAALKDVSVYTFLMPILGGDSLSKSRDIWCAKDSAKAWRAWIIEGVAAPKAVASCDSSALERNQAFGRAHRVNGTPATFFEDGTRKPGAIPADRIEKQLVAAAKK